MKNILANNVILAILILALAFFGQIFLPSMGVFFFDSWLVFAIVFLINFFKNALSATALSLLAGIVVDFLSGGAFGIFTIAFFLLSVLMQFIIKRLQKDRLVAFLALLLFAIVFFAVAGYFLPKLFNFIHV